MTRFTRTSRRLWRQEDAFLTVEAIIWIPFLMATVLAVFAVFDLFRAQTLNHKAAYTVGDTLSRETSLITDTYIDNTEKLAGLLTRQDVDNVGVRVTVLEWDADTNSHVVKWSKSRAPFDELTEEELETLSARAPMMVNGEQIILTETWMAHRAYELIRRGSGGYFASVFTRPRYTPQLRFAGS